MKTLAIVAALLGAVQLAAAAPEVTLHLLDHTDKQTTKERFWIDWKKSRRGIVTTKTVTGEPAAKIVSQLRVSLRETEAAHFCGHDPIYGIEATDPDGKALRTSLCFTCLTWVKPGKRLDIDGVRGPENPLCKLLRETIELPKELLDAEKKAAGGTAGK